MAMFHDHSILFFVLPEWLLEYASAYQPDASLVKRMEFVIEASRLNVVNNTGGPFSAGIFRRDTHEMISLGVNLVPTQNLSALHAEIVAISLAQKKLGTFHLGIDPTMELELLTSTEPCAMCLGAVVWSGIGYLVSGATDQDARSIGFDEGPKPVNWIHELNKRGIHVRSEILRDQARAILEEYRDAGREIYNARVRDYRRHNR